LVKQPVSRWPIVLALLGILALLAGAIYLLRTNPASGAWAQNYDPTGIWWLSTLIAALPVIVLLASLALFHTRAHTAALIGLATALAIALLVYRMPLRLALTTTAVGAATGLFRSAGSFSPSSFFMG
jgi:L-lactate permease